MCQFAGASFAYRPYLHSVNWPPPTKRFNDGTAGAARLSKQQQLGNAASHPVHPIDLHVADAGLFLGLKRRLWDAGRQSD